jgi:TonB family protein
LKTGETGLRSIAIEHPSPDYPASSISRGSTGVAVAAVRLGADGDVTRVNVLQAPDPDIDASLRRTLRQWRFLPPQVDGSKDPYVMEGKLTFYFQIRDGRPTVEEPQDPSSGRNRPRHRGWVIDPEPTSTVDDAALASLLRTGDAVLVDVAGREPFATGDRASVHIPFDELSVRGPRELPRGKAIVLECVAAGVDRCSASAATLQSAGFTDVRVWRPHASQAVGARAPR